MAAPTIQYKPGALDADISDRVSDRLSRGLVAKQMAERYAVICRHSLPHFTVPEWRLIMDATNGLISDEHWQYWRHNVRDAVTLSGAAKRFGIADADRFLAKIDSLMVAESIAVLDRTEQFWAAVQQDEEATVPGEHDEYYALVEVVTKYLQRCKDKGEAEPLWRFDADTEKSDFGKWAVKKKLLRYHSAEDGLTLLPASAAS